MPASRVFKSRAMLAVEAKLERPLEDFLAQRYREKTQAQIAEEIGVDVATVNRWMRALGIEARFPGQRPPTTETTEAIA